MIVRVDCEQGEMLWVSARYGWLKRWKREIGKQIDSVSIIGEMRDEKDSAWILFSLPTIRGAGGHSTG